MDYSKFDKINYDTESEDEAESVNVSKLNIGNDLPQKVVPAPNKIKMTGKSKEGRLKFEYEGTDNNGEFIRMFTMEYHRQNYL